MSKRLLFIEDLYDFYSNKYKRSTHFSSEKSGEPIIVQVHGKLNFEENCKDIEGLLPVHLQACHTNLNLNRSNISENSMMKALPSFKNRPILGYLHQVESEDGQWEFYGHNAHEDENGDIVYEEVPVGIIPESCNAQLVYDEEKDKTYCEVDGYIFEEYSKAADVLRREKECSVSVELSIRDMSFDAKEKCLNIEDFFFSGVTILGKTDMGESVEPGMAGSNIKLADFSEKNNSLFLKYEDKMIEFQERLEKLECTCSNIQFAKGGKSEKMKKFEELLTKYNKTVEDITFEYENLSDDELTAKFEENFGKTDKNKENNTENNNSDNSTNNNNSDGNGDGTATENNACGGSSGGKNKKNSVECTYIVGEETKTFAVSLQDKIYAIQDLVNATYAEADNTYYGVSVYDNYVVMCDYWSGRYYKQSYTDENDIYSLTGDRIEVYAEFVTADEQKELQSMRSNYSSISERLAQYEEAEEIADKMTVFSDEAYSNYLDTEEFKTLMDKETVKKFTKEELSEKADAALGKVVKTTKTFSTSPNEKDKKEKFPSFLAFNRVEQNTSFLDGLLKK